MNNNRLNFEEKFLFKEVLRICCLQNIHWSNGLRHDKIIFVFPRQMRSAPSQNPEGTQVSFYFEYMVNVFTENEVWTAQNPQGTRVAFYFQINWIDIVVQLCGTSDESDTNAIAHNCVLQMLWTHWDPMTRVCLTEHCHHWFHWIHFHLLW